MNTFFEVTPKTVLMIFVGGNLKPKFHKKLFGEFGEIRAKIIRIPKTLPAPKPMMKRALRTRCPPFESTEG